VTVVAAVAVAAAAAAAFPTSEEKHFHKSASRYMCAQFPRSGH